MKVRSPYNYDSDIVSFSSGVDCSESPSRTQQHFRDECDINVMVQRFQRTGLPDAPPVPPGVQDFVDVHDFQGAMQLIVEAREAFQSLPSRVRDRFHNNPAEYLEFIGDETNLDEAVKLGIANKRPEPVVNDGVVDDPVSE